MKQILIFMKKLLLGFSVFILTLGTTFAQNIPVDPTVRIGTLSNGMKYYIKQNKNRRKKLNFGLPLMLVRYSKMTTREVLPTLWSI